MPTQRVHRLEEGFTLVELLMVMVISSILVTLGLTGFLGQREKGWDAAVESDLRNAATFQQTAVAEAGADEFAISIEELQAVGFRTSLDANYHGRSAVLTVTARGGTSYCMTARSASGRYFAFSSDDGLKPGATAFDSDTCT